MSIHRIVIGTAGHIDHGKSTLVKALTGIDPDRLPEEKERGLTIDLGFAPWKLPDGTRIGFVDVPGHERFVKNMVAGATGIDFVILVVAADDGIMPQTREHLEIMQLLGVRRGVVALTKVDLAEEGYADLVEQEVRSFVEGSFLEEAPIFRLSPPSGLGMEEFRRELERLARETPPRSAEGVFRMPIQRVFSSPGHGTVVTGIPVSGRVAPGEKVEILPLGRTGKVRGIQAYKEAAEAAQAGHSSALNLSDLEFREIRRGMVAATPGFFRASTLVEAKVLIHARGKRALEDRTPIRLHVGTSEALGRLVLLDRKRLQPGEEAYAQLRLEEPVVVAPGDRFVLRLETPPLTVGGGAIVGESGRRLRRNRAELIADLARKEESLADRRRAVAYALERRGVRPAALEDLLGETKLPREDLLRELMGLESTGEASAVRPGEIFLHRTGLQEARRILAEKLDEFFRKNPARIVVELNWLREASRLEERILDFLLREDERAGKLSLEKGQVRLAGKKASLSPEAASRKERIEKELKAGRFSPPEVGALAGAAGCPESEAQKLLTLLVDEGEAIRAGTLYFSREAFEEAKRAVVENVRARGELDIPSLRDRLGTSRKYLIPLLEYLDLAGVTLRQGGRRILKSR